MNKADYNNLQSALEDWMFADLSEKQGHAHLVADLFAGARIISATSIYLPIRSGIVAVIASTQRDNTRRSMLGVTVGFIDESRSEVIDEEAYDDASVVLSVLVHLGLVAHPFKSFHTGIKQRSDSKEGQAYRVGVSDGRVVGCSCRASRPCKHMNRVRALLGDTAPERDQKPTPRIISPSEERAKFRAFSQGATASVPYSLREVPKAHGGRWCNTSKRWWFSNASAAMQVRAKVAKHSARIAA